MSSHNPPKSRRNRPSVGQEPDEYHDRDLANLYSLGLLSPAATTKQRSRAPRYSETLDSSSRTSQSRSDYHSSSQHSSNETSRPSGHFGARRQPALSTASLPSGANTRSRRGMTGMLDIDRSYTRRDRTFAGSQCVVCEEPLEHTLRGEKILQLSCAHVTHEACFYEFIRDFDSHRCPGCEAPLGLDSSRGGNVLDIEKLSAIVRSLQLNNEAQQQQQPQQPQQQPSRSSQATPTPYNTNPTYSTNVNSGSRQPSINQKHRRDQSTRSDRRAESRQQHTRNTSAGTIGTASEDPAEQQAITTRRHDYDVHEMESTVATPRSRMPKPAIPSPTVVVRSEFPTLNRSRQQQSLTCLVTIEVPEQPWPGSFENGQNFESLPPELPGEMPEQVSKKTPPPGAMQNLNPMESADELERITEDLQSRVDNWHGLDFSRFGKLHLHSTLQVSKDRQSWQELECYLFTEMLICVKEKRSAQQAQWEGLQKGKSKCTLKGSIMIKKHLDQIETSELEDYNTLTLGLSVTELPTFHLHFPDQTRCELWKQALTILYNSKDTEKNSEYEPDASVTDDEEYRDSAKAGVSSRTSTHGTGRSVQTAPTSHSEFPPAPTNEPLPGSINVPVDVVVVIPVSSSMHGLKITLLRDMLRFMVQNLGPRDRMGLVTFGSSGGAAPLVGMATKSWAGWNKVFDSIRAVGQKTPRADLVEGANIAMDLLMQRKSFSPISSILIVSDSSTSDVESIDFVVSRAEAAKVSIYCFGLGLTHKPDTMIELSTRTKASYTYVKDWMMLRECIAGCLGSLQTTSHQNVKLKLRLPDGSPAKFVKISGALQITKRATGRDAEAALGDLRFGDKRDVLVQLAIAPETSAAEQLPQDPWESIVSGLEALGGPLEQDETRAYSVEEVPMIQADLVYGDILREGSVSQLSRPCLLAITMLPPKSKGKQPESRPSTPPIPPHPSIVQRRMELLTSDMLTRALTLVTRGQQERAHHLLRETRSILKGLGKGSLPPLPSRASARVNPSQAPNGSVSTPSISNASELSPTGSEMSPNLPNIFNPASSIDLSVMSALDAELESSLEWINHPAVFARDSRKAILQAIGVISSQRSYTFRTSLESLWAGRINGIRKVTDRSKIWREASEEALAEES